MRADRDYALMKPQGVCRVAVFGDSFMMGYELDLANTFTTKLESLLRAEGLNSEVLNFSVSGFGTAEMLRTYESFARSFDPDVVIFSWHYSDVEDNVRSDLYRLQGGKLESTHRNYLPGVGAQDFLMRSRVYRFIADHSELYTLVRDKSAILTKALLVHFRENSTPTSPEATTNDSPLQLDADDAARAAQKQANLALSSAIVAHAAQVVSKDGRDFYLLEIPVRISRVTFRSSVQELDSSVRSRIKIISPMAAFSAAARPDLKLYFEQGPGHFTSLATELVARDTAAVLIRSPRLSTCMGSPQDSDFYVR